MRSIVSRAARRLALALVLIGAPALVTSIAQAGRPTAASPPRAGSKENARVELGRRLFFDPVVSRVGMRSCADCHDPRHGYSDAARVSADDRVATRRHSQTLIDGADNPSAHWDGAFHRVEDLVTSRVTLAARGRFSSGHELASGGAFKGPDGGVAPGVGAGSGVPSGSLPTPRATEPARDTGPKGGSGSGEPGSGGGSAGGSGSGGGTGAEAYKAPDSDKPDGAREPTDAPTTPTEAPSAPGAPSAPSAPGPAAGPSAGAAPAAPSVPAAPAAPGAAPAAGNAPRGADGANREPTALDPYAAPDALADGDLEPGFISAAVDTTKLPSADRVIEDAGRYREGFEAAFGAPTVTIAKISEAIGAYCHSIRSGASAFDRFVGGDSAALSPEAKRGLELFKGRANCAACHLLGRDAGERAALTDYRVHVTGVSWAALSGDDDAAKAKVAALDADEGAGGVTGRPKEARAFKTPTLRDVARRGPYMHDGSLATLEAVVLHYAKPPRDPALDFRVAGFDAARRDVADLVAFLRALSSDVRPGLATSAWKARAHATRLTLVDAKGKPLANQRFLVVPAGDVLPGGLPTDAAIALTTDERGVASFTAPAWTHVRVVMPDGVRTRSGALVPDSCRDARIEVAVRGRAAVFVTFPKGQVAPLTLVGEHESADFMPDRRLPRTVLRREAVMPDGTDRQVALYKAYVRTDAPATVTLHLPKKVWGLDRLRMAFEAGETRSLDLSK